MSQLIARYGAPAPQPGLGVIMEQEEWPEYTGGMTAWGMIVYLSQLAYGAKLGPLQLDCGMDGDTFTCRLFVYPLTVGLNYSAHLSYGELSGRRVEMVTKTERVRLRLQTTITLEYPVAEIRSARWQGECYDKNFAVVPPPALRISADRREVVADRAVYGTAVIEYASERHVYNVTIGKREDSVENGYSSVAWCRIDNATPQHLVLDPPPTAYGSGDQCGRDAHFSVTGDDDDPSMPDPHADRTTVYGWCDPHVLISDNITGV